MEFFFYFIYNGQKYVAPNSHVDALSPIGVVSGGGALGGSLGLNEFMRVESL